MAYVKADTWVLQQIKATGLPESGGSINAYIYDTSTPLAMFTDNAGSGSATSFTLNSLGMPQTGGGTAVDIYLDDSNVYKFIVKDSDGTQVGPTIGPVYPQIGASVLSSTSTPGGASYIGYYDPLAPAYLKTVSDIINGDEVSVWRFIPTTKHSGIRASSNTDDLKSYIQDADDAIVGGQLFWPRGLYNIGAAINKDPKTTWRGEGNCDLRHVTASWYGTVIQGEFEGNFVSIIGTANNRMNGAIKNMVITAPDGNSLTAAKGIYCEDVSWQTFEDVYVHRLGAKSVHCKTNTLQCNKIMFTRCNIAPPNAGIGLHLENVDDSWLTDTELAGTTYAAMFETCNFIHSIGSRYQLAATANVYVKDSAWVQFIGGTCDLSDGDGFYIRNSHDILVSPRNFRSIEGSLVKMYATTGETVSRVSIESNSCEVGTKSNTDGVTFDNDSGNGTIANISVIDNDLSQCTNKIVGADQCEGALVYRDNNQQIRTLAASVSSYTHDITEGDVVTVSGVLGADMDVTLSQYPTNSGITLRFIRNASATGAFNMNIKNYTGTTLKALATAGTWCTVTQQNNGTWFLSGYGAL